MTDAEWGDFDLDAGVWRLPATDVSGRSWVRTIVMAALQQGQQIGARVQSKWADADEPF